MEAGGGQLPRRHHRHRRQIVRRRASNRFPFMRPRAVAARHLGIHLVDRARELQVAVLAVHVVRARARVVAQHDVVVLHL